MRLDSVKTQLIMYLSLLLVILTAKDKNTLFLFTAVVAVISAAGADCLISYLKNRGLVLTESSIISGLIIGFVISSEQPWWIFSLASSFAMASKHILRPRGRHIFNPAAFGIFLVAILFNAPAEWKATGLWYVIVPAGLYFAYKIRKLEAVSAYVIILLCLFGVQAALRGTAILSILGLLNFFYIFVMLIEPKTSPTNYFGKIIFGAGAALLVFITTQISAGFDVYLASLLAMNMFVPLFIKLK